MSWCNWKCLRILGAGALLGSYGVRLLTSRDAKKAYTCGTAAVMRMKDEVLKDVSLIRENCNDIAADAREINEKRQAELDAKQIEDAKAVLAAAGSEEQAAEAAKAAEAPKPSYEPEQAAEEAPKPAYEPEEVLKEVPKPAYEPDPEMWKRPIVEEESKKSAFDELVEKESEKLDEGLQEEERLQREAEALLASLGIKL